ncbi:polyisoprenoid-binding protein YceI [Saccharopolyspora lacisalsi]|uniref:Polyisoprenoid-binding protein YceI n=1 Tax=Halosaccharopolyspora lacisalsi TaxID=1000566 RepID=A0A839DYI2_9PSEU|nr:YceI family protein [Halosaccharopolyspora lacisalsi]MBA8825789.1 polyisoprenoid-binding protein YceI [Halosaccharopolyspora lacisalsi]
MTTSTSIPDYVVGTWNIDAVHSGIEFTLRHMGVGRSRGRFDSFEGEIVTAENPLDSSVTATIDAASFNTGNADRDAHVRNSDFLDVENHPTITFRSTAIREDGDEWAIDGELTLRGVTKPVTLSVEPGGFTDDGQGGKMLGGTASTTINRTDFGVGPDGGAMLGEKVKITLDIEAQSS